MKKLINLIFSLVVFVGLTGILTKSAWAYLDPGRGSYMLQVVMGGVLGIIMAIKISWQKIWKLVLKIFKKTKESSSREHSENTS